MTQNSIDDMSRRRRWWTSVGPGLITACVVIGPGSILTSSQVGAANEFSMLWVVALSVVFMMVYMTLGARLGVVASQAPADLIRQRVGPWLAVLVGVSVFLISALFQAGNNLGVHSAFEPYTGFEYVVVVFNVLAIAFLFVFKNVYRAIEKLMMLFVALMLISFAANLIWTGPDFGRMADGFIPRVGQIDINVLGLVGTTFVITAAYYQAYLVRQKGWTVANLKSGLTDARVGAVIMALITIMLMSVAAAGLYDAENPVKLTGAADVAAALNKLFGSSAQMIFCIGLFSAAYSSFLVNSMIGGFILADGLGLGSKPTDLWPKVLTSAVLLIGMVIAMAVVIMKFDRVPTIIAAQAVTVIASPLVAGTLLWLTNRRDIMGEHRNGPLINTLAILGLLLLVAIAWRTATTVIPKKWEQWQSKPAQSASLRDSQALAKCQEFHAAMSAAHRS
jgi:NRAMP (natural resistance-associated macrophage protein)-like metal ion transporter